MNNKKFSFILGFFAGMATTAIILLVLAVCLMHQKDTDDEPIVYPNDEAIVDDTYDIEDIQYFEVRGKKGYVTLNTKTPKDSVKILLGEPQSIDINVYGSNHNSEEWKYEFPGQGSYGTNRTMTIKFIDGEIKRVTNY